MEYYKWGQISIPVIRHKAVVVGSGAAGLAAAWHLARLQVHDFCLVTENMNAGTSRNTGSDKQTYYKLTLAGSEADSVEAMAADLFRGGSMDGDLARVEAALSTGCFSRLCDLGVPFPQNRFGEYVGYRTDHDPRQRATSAGPLTSRLMTEALQRAVAARDTKVYDRLQAIKLLTDQENRQVCGLLCLNQLCSEDENDRFRLILCKYIIFAVGGPAMLYADSVYPASQYGATGLAIEAGASAKNLTEWQYGLASVKPRWNVSGSFQQVLPRYWSAEADGSDRRDFLDEVISDYQVQLGLIFRKGYEWPFDVRKLPGSSLIDILVYRETVLRGRKVFLDFRSNPGGRDIIWADVDLECREYLSRADSMQNLPFARLSGLNRPAVDFYLRSGIDLAREPLEIRLCAQHHNGGLSGDAWWQSDLEGLFPVGEANGSHGIYRPGGSALNSGQAGAVRAAERISRLLKANKEPPGDDLPASACRQLEEQLSWLEKCLRQPGDFDIIGRYDRAQKLMSRSGGPFREAGLLEEAIGILSAEIAEIKNGLPAGSPRQLGRICRYRELIFTQRVFLAAMLDYMRTGGGSRGSALYLDKEGAMAIKGLGADFNSRPPDLSKADLIQEVRWHGGELLFSWRPVRPLPKQDDVFEVVWKQYRADSGTM